jgi:hypothetical protein
MLEGLQQRRRRVELAAITAMTGEGGEGMV